MSDLHLDPDETNFKRGAVRPGAIALGLAIAMGAGAALFFGVQTEEAKLSVPQMVELKKNIYVLAKDEQLPHWRRWAASSEPAMVQEALAQLAWARDAEAATLSAKALARGNHQINGVAAQALAWVGSPSGDVAKPALLEALKKADQSDKPQIVWALVELGEATIFPEALAVYRLGHLSSVERLGGGRAFDAERLANLVSRDELSKLATDESVSVRQLVASMLSAKPESKHLATLTTLVQDADVDVAREAATGLGRIGDEAARGPLLTALGKADKKNRVRFLEALRDGVGGEGLVMALGSIAKEPAETNWFQTRQIFEMLRQVVDPRAADALVAWAERTQLSPHWRGEVGVRLAEMGDIRAAKYLGERLGETPEKLYALERFWEADDGGHMSRHDLPRVVATRMLADLAALHSDSSAQVLEAAEAPVIKWLKDRLQPHANGLRFLANAKSAKILPDLRAWAFPGDPLPKEGQQPPFPAAFEVAQSALRYIGRIDDRQSFGRVLEQLKRKDDAKMDITQDSLQGAGLALLGMSLRALAYGASQGLSEFGDPKAVKPLTELIEDELWHEEARVAACEALAWCAEDKDIQEIAKKAQSFAAKPEPKKQFIGGCYAITLATRSFAGSGVLAGMLTPNLPPGVLVAMGRAIGASPIDVAVTAQLNERLSSAETRTAAALALILGGNADTAARTVARFVDYGPEALGELKDQYFRAFGYWSDEDLKRGNLFRWVENAEAIARVKIGDTPQEWARERLRAQFDNLTFDNGPHSETRVVLRARLYTMAKSGSPAEREGAVAVLKFMREQGVLMALRNESGTVGTLAKRAFHELLNPVSVVAEDLSALKEASRGKAN